MKKFLSMLFSFLILLQSFFPSVFAQSEAIENYTELQEESSNTSDDFFENSEDQENTDSQPDLDGLITNG
ncbi:MAG: hypothetical protein EOM23_02305 [Candidatus Moranbacteria bacterium]|nr:hypothetical protein [Candidatus Moranbacteria bacterium]